MAHRSLLRRMPIVTMARFDLELYLRLVMKHRSRHLYVVPPVMLALAQSPAVEKYDLTCVESIFSGAAPLAPDVGLRAAERLKCHVYQGYGLTETSPPIAIMQHDHGSGAVDAIGVPVPNTAVRIMDLIGEREVPDGQPGELWARGPQCMKGYLNKPLETSAMITPDGWVRTGDIAVRGPDGFLRIVDRIKELIKYKGLQVAPAELEAILLEHPAVADAAVVGWPDEEAGEVPKAYVVPKGDASAEALMAFVAAKVAPHKKVRAVEFLDRIPKSPSGKILRRILRPTRRSLQ